MKIAMKGMKCQTNYLVHHQDHIWLPRYNWDKIRKGIIYPIPYLIDNGIW